MASHLARRRGHQSVTSVNMVPGQVNVIEKLKTKFVGPVDKMINKSTIDGCDLSTQNIRINKPFVAMETKQ